MPWYPTLSNTLPKHPTLYLASSRFYLVFIADDNTRPLQLPFHHKKPKLHEVTEAEETEEFSLLADVFAPQFDKRVPENTARLGKRVHLTSADKKKVNKASIGLPDPSTLKLLTYDTRPFILKHTIPLEEFRKKYSRQLINTRINPELDTIFEDRQLKVHSTPAVQQRTSLGSIPDQQPFAALPELAPGPSEYLHNRQTPKDLAPSVTVDSLINTGIKPEIGTIFEELEVHSAPAVQQRTSLGGTTLLSIPDQQTFAALPNLAPGPSEYLQNRQTSKDLASSVTVDSRPTNVKPETFVKVNTWLDQINVPTGAEPESPTSFSDLVHDEEVWDLIERIVRQRKSPLRQMPNTMSTETTNTSIRGSDGSRPSVNYPRPSESNSRTVTNTIKDYPGTLARRPKNMPSGSQLPSCWNDEMDEFICHMEGQCEFSTKSIVRALKHRFAQLREVSPRFLSPKLLWIKLLWIKLLWIKLLWIKLTLHLACAPGRGHPASHRHPWQSG